MEKILVTGASSYIGREVLNVLAGKGRSVYCAVRNRAVPSAGGVVNYSQDLLDLSGVSNMMREIKPDKLLHIAWYVEHKDFLKSDENKKWVDASKNLIDEFQKQGGKRFVGIGTCFEDMATHQNYPYVMCKKEVQKYLQEAACGNALGQAWIKIFYPYGAHERAERLVPHIVRALARNEEAGPNFGLAVRDYIYNEDQADQIVRIVDGSVQGMIETGTGRETTLKEVAETIGRIMGKEHLVKCGNALPTDQPARVVADMSKFRREVGELKLHSLEGGLEKAVSWHLQNL